MGQHMIKHEWGYGFCKEFAEYKTGTEMPNSVGIPQREVAYGGGTGVPA